MEIKATLNKPYTLEERRDFVIFNSYQNHYKLIETSEALEAWGLTSEEQIEQEKQAKNQEIDDKIKELQLMALTDILEGNKENIKLYNEVINGLEETRPQ